MELDNKMYAEYTRYPNIFLHSYWGNHRLRRINGRIICEYGLETITENRNRFITEYSIKKYYYLPKIRGRKKIDENAMIGKELYNGSYKYDIRDHIEYYKCSDGRLLTIFSKDINNEEDHNFILSNGYTLIEPLYWIDQRSYLKFI